MNRLGKELIQAAVMGILLPLAVVSLGVNAGREPEEIPVYRGGPEMETVYTIGVRDGETVREMKLEDYLVGVVLGEMPSYFEPDALMAQAAAARTYTAKACYLGGKHGDGSVCTDPGCCQAYWAPEDYLREGGQPERLEKVVQAVEQTAGDVITYEGELIEATYYACSGGRSEDAAAVWGQAFPYLCSVDSPGEENADHYQDTYFFSVPQLEKILDTQLSGDWLGEPVRTEGGGVAVLRLGGMEYTGTELRKKFSLPSTAFTVTATDRGVEIRTRGYGHRVGMSQYGANAMALEGHTWQEILAHYYPGTSLGSAGDYLEEYCCKEDKIMIE